MNVLLYIAGQQCICTCTIITLQYNADCTLLDVDGNFAYDSSDDTEIKALLLKHMMFKGSQSVQSKRMRVLTVCIVTIMLVHIICGSNAIRHK